MVELVNWLFKNPIYFVPLFISSIFMMKYGFKEMADINHRPGDDIPNPLLKGLCAGLGFALCIASGVGFGLSLM
jgi:hypothetical protein